MSSEGEKEKDDEKSTVETQTDLTLGAYLQSTVIGHVSNTEMASTHNASLSKESRVNTGNQNQFNIEDNQVAPPVDRAKSETKNKPNKKAWSCILSPCCRKSDSDDSSLLDENIVEYVYAMNQAALVEKKEECPDSYLKTQEERIQGSRFSGDDNNEDDDDTYITNDLDKEDKISNINFVPKSILTDEGKNEHKLNIPSILKSEDKSNIVHDKLVYDRSHTNVESYCQHLPHILFNEKKDKKYITDATTSKNVVSETKTDGGVTATVSFLVNPNENDAKPDPSCVPIHQCPADVTVTTKNTVHTKSDGMSNIGLTSGTSTLLPIKTSTVCEYSSTLLHTELNTFKQNYSYDMKISKSDGSMLIASIDMTSKSFQGTDEFEIDNAAMTAAKCPESVSIKNASAQYSKATVTNDPLDYYRDFRPIGCIVDKIKGMFYPRSYREPKSNFVSEKQLCKPKGCDNFTCTEKKNAGNSSKKHKGKVLIRIKNKNDVDPIASIVIRRPGSAGRRKEKCVKDDYVKYKEENELVPANITSLKKCCCKDHVKHESTKLLPGQHNVCYNNYTKYNPMKNIYLHLAAGKNANEGNVNLNSSADFICRTAIITDPDYVQK